MKQRPERPAFAPPRPMGRLAWLLSPMPRVVVSVGITQIIGWGTTVYALGVLAKPIAIDTGWRLDLVILGIALALLASGVVSTFVGRQIDQRGGRLVLTSGSVLIAVLLVFLAWSPNIGSYLLAWTLLGVAMRMCLYDAAFPALVQVVPDRGRTAISYLTLFGSFASSLFWPIGHELAGIFGWRGTLLIFAALNLFICAPLHWWGLGLREAQTVSSPVATDNAASRHQAAAPVLEGNARTIAMVLFAIVISGCAFVFGALAVLLPALLEASGVSAREAVILASIKGVAQFVGRVCDIRWGKNLGVLTVGRIAVVCLPLSFAALVIGSGGFALALLFTILFGVSNGLITIVRGAVPLVLFGPVGYGAVMGLLATPYLITNAIAPVMLAALIERTNIVVGEWVMISAGILALLAMETMAAWHRSILSYRPES